MSTEDTPPAEEGRPGPEPDDIPSGLPDDAPEAQPLGSPDAEPDGEGARRRGADAMPGLPTEGEPPSGG